ncbi:GNAT family N-acetyltransferase [Streptomyces sp. NBC_01306]|uniref:GNAT family N-acetyltransferase n=1 Tax=Streptomyces sp. NBC_01306 TaxID=2903819 RepID=UPI00225517DF|nr:GNAT family N-acetyltransferase [Streptomyces sp. NBC_01306]MCX4724699.1 GNAT family N-acetyltransferase [Streptomyces sp. NBC_01306]
MRDGVRIEPWSEDDLTLLRRMNAPELLDHLGGPETEDQVLVRHERYVGMSAGTDGTGTMFRVVATGTGEAVGTVGYWESSREGELIYESGWGVLKGHQGRGIATAAVRAVLERAGQERKHRFLHAFPSVDNPPSNAVCRKSGFSLLGDCDFEYPPGRSMRCNDWRVELTF